MSYLGRLIDSCLIKRPSVGFSALYSPNLGTPVQVGDSVACLLADTSEGVLAELFGQNIVASAVIYFPPGTDVRPGKNSVDGTADQIVVTQARTGNVETWYALTTKDLQGRGVVAACQRWGV